MTDVFSIKRRFGIIGSNVALDRAIAVASQVAETDLSVLVLGESGTGKESMPRIVHQFSRRKHGPYIAVNCGAIPEGTIDSELFGHEKGAFTGATDSRKGYFEEAHGGTIFLDEVAELPLTTQVRLLRVLETGEFIRVGSSKVQKTDVRVVAATNVDFARAIAQGRFREDLYYRLSQVPIYMPPLRERKEDVVMLFRKFTTDFSVTYGMPPLQLTPEAASLLEAYHWPGNIRQLKNIAEQISILQTERLLDAPDLAQYLPEAGGAMVPTQRKESAEGMNEREILYKVLFDMRSELADLKQLVLDLIENGGGLSDRDAALVEKLYRPAEGAGWVMPRQLESGGGARAVGGAGGQGAVSGSTEAGEVRAAGGSMGGMTPRLPETLIAAEDVEAYEEVLSLQDSERDLIRKALEKHRNRRKYAARELGISERTLYRKIKEYGLA
jgi:transcriptional regulator with PAS, ATPase and Fis domain